MRAILRKVFLKVMGTLKRPQSGIHIINSHYICSNIVDYKRDVEIFDSYLAFLSKFAKFITLEEATKRIRENDIPKKEVLLAFTFDDGFEECHSIIATLLEKYNTKGAFFINANYIDSNIDYQNEFNKRIKIKTKKPMSWSQVIDLHKCGHLIGSHNLDHTNFSNLSLKDIEIQLKNNKEVLEEKLNYKCEYFAFTYGQLKDFSKEALELTEKYHKYIYSGTNYKSYFSYNGRVLNRRHQEAYWPLTHIKYFVSCSKTYNI